LTPGILGLLQQYRHEAVLGSCGAMSAAGESRRGHPVERDCDRCMERGAQLGRQRTSASAQLTQLAVAEGKWSHCCNIRTDNTPPSPQTMTVTIVARSEFSTLRSLAHGGGSYPPPPPVFVRSSLNAGRKANAPICFARSRGQSIPRNALRALITDTAR
jgi:hypothetical protein